MKITHIECVPLKIPFARDAPTSGWRGRDFSTLEILLIKVETADGVAGWGEAFSYNCQRAVRVALDDMVAPLAIGRDSRDIAGLLYEIQKLLHIYGRYGILNFALSGLEIALWDVAGKRAGRPLAGLLGGFARTEIEAYASLFRTRDPDVVGRHVCAALAAGYKSVKVHETTEREVKAARIAAGSEIPIMLDTNCAWTVTEARTIARQLKEYNIRWFEEPIFPPEDYESLSVLRVEDGIPIAAGENACTAYEFRKMFAAGAVTYAQPSVTKVGGITEFRKVAALAEASGVSLMPHSPYFGPGFLATLQLLAAMPTPSPIERFFLTLEAQLYGEVVNLTDGTIRLPTGPGLGQEPDPMVIKKYCDHRE